MRRLWLWVLGVFLVFAVFFVLGADFLADVLWHDSMGYVDSFYKILGLKILPGLVAFVLIYLFLMINWLFARKTWEAEREEEGLEPVKVSKWLTGVLGVLLSFAFTSNILLNWQTVARFLGRNPFGIEDPIFHMDVSFYVFVLPLIQGLYVTAFAVAVFTLLFTGVFYLATRSITFYKRRVYLGDRARLHLLLLIILIVALAVLGLQINSYELLRSPTGAVYGAGYSDVYGRLVVNRILQILCVLAVFVFALDLFRREYKWTVWTLLVLVAVGILGQFAAPILQKVVVEPNELNKERRFIEHNIGFTRFAYGLDEVVSAQFEPALAFSSDDWIDNTEVLDNVRLWDWRALEKSFSQLQELRYYYKMGDIDIDRYQVDGKTTQMALSVREIDSNYLTGTARSWVNKHLVFTHGYGFVMSSIHGVTPQGIPEFLVRDIPPKGIIDVTRPEIYFGERTNDYVIVKTRQKEMNYPSGEDNVYTTYQGDGGVKVGGLFGRLLFALKFGTSKILFSSDITSDSQILYYRNITERVKRLAPFLILDPDPYAVTVEGGIYWLMDAYTTTSYFPYSQPISGLGNYMRAAFKVVVNAYTGSVDIYLYDEADPIGRAYKNVFPNLIKPKSEFPQEFAAHIRYPEQLFLAQAQILQTYHMTNPEVFFNKEDVWDVPQEIYQGQTVRMDPYYTMVQFPGENRAEFVLMLPFTPRGKQNMVSWLAGRSDGDNYGELVLYRFPKDRVIYGPMQIEARINQDAEISQMLNLWNQQGSSVQRGNLLVLPLNDNILYVEPIYLQASQGQIPELRLVVLSDGNNIIYGRTFREALDRIQSLVTDETALPEDGYKTDDFVETKDADYAELARLAWEAFLESEEALQSGPDWERYGRAQAKLRELLARLNAN